VEVEVLMEVKVEAHWWRRTGGGTQSYSEQAVGRRDTE